MTVPSIAVYEFDITESSPEFVRHIPGGSPSYVKTLGSGSLSDYLYFDTKATKPGYSSYETKVLVFRVTTTGNTVFNMRFYSPDASALTPGSSYYQYGVSGVWGAFERFANSGSINMNEVPTSLPSSQNLFRQNSSTSITGILDTDVSQYLYLNLCLDDTFPGGRFGSGGSSSYGVWQHRVTYDYT